MQTFISLFTNHKTFAHHKKTHKIFFYILPGKLNFFVTALKIESTFFRIFTAKAVKGSPGRCGGGEAGLGLWGRTWGRRGRVYRV